MSPFRNVVLALVFTLAAGLSSAQGAPVSLGSTGGTTPDKAEAAPTATDAPKAMAPAPTSPDTELLRSGDIVIYQRDYDRALERLPENLRGGFGVDPARINTLLQQLLTTKTLVMEARAAHLDQDTAVQHQIATETDKVLAGAMLERNVMTARQEFDALPNMEAAARERWVTQQDKYREPTRYKTTYLLFRTPEHSPEEARTLAIEARGKILAGADMSALARQISEAPTAKTDGGVRDWATTAGLDPATTRALERLANVGDVSPPLLTAIGVQLIRLDGKEPGPVEPFEKVKLAILEQLRSAYVEGKVTDHYKAIRNNPNIVLNQAALDALIVRVDPAEVRRITQETAAKSRTEIGNRPEAPPPRALRRAVPGGMGPGPQVNTPGQ